MYGCGPAASADNADAIILDEVFVILSKFGGREFVNRMSAFVLGKACIRQNRNILSRIRLRIFRFCRMQAFPKTKADMRFTNSRPPNLLSITNTSSRIMASALSADAAGPHPYI